MIKSYLYTRELKAVMHAISSSPIGKKTLTAQDVVGAVKKVTGWDFIYLASPTRKRDIADARFIAMLIMSRECGLSDRRIGDFFRRDRTTVINARKAAEAMMDTDAKFYACVIAVEDALLESYYHG